MTNTLWLSYIPRHVAHDIAFHSAESPIGREQRFEAVALFADVSGFTAMSEALGRSGRSGTEELTNVLNAYFGPMIDLIHAYGGVIGKFGGDAMTVLFPYAADERAPTVRCAIQCALDMQAAMHRYEAIATSVGTFSLAMKAGIAFGPVFCTTVGDPEIRLEYIIAGRALDLCADAEHHAGKGDVVIHNALLGDAEHAGVVEERGSYSLVAALRHRAPGVPLGELGTFPEQGLAIVARYLHPAVAGRMAAGHAGFINEHRKVTVLFVRFDGFEYEHDPGVRAKLQQYFEAVVRIVERYDGYLNKVDMGDKGSKYIVLFGAPVQHEDDEERSLRCALELRALQDIPVRIGVNTGLVYCGQVGSEARQEYTVIGDPVNLAARLMQAAGPEQVLVSGFTQQRVAESFTWEGATSLSVKGKAEPVQVYTLGSVNEQEAVRLQERVYRLALVGREAELRVAGDVIERALAGHGQILGITAEAGMGKSRLNAEIIRLAAQHGFVGYGGAGQSYGTTSSYLVWQALWRGFFGINSSWSPETQRSHLEHELEVVDPHLIQRMPLLQVLLNLPIPDNELTRSLDPQQRAELLRSLVLQCLRERAREVPTLLVLEDAHWMDPLSLELLEFAGRNIQDLPVLLIVLYRPLEGDCPEIVRIARFSHATEIRLTELTPEEAHQLITARLEQQWDEAGGLPETLVQRVMTKAQGNPFYIEEMINYIHDRGINPQDMAALEALDLPDSLHNLIMSRIDTLGHDEKTTLKVASVIGRLFKADWLWGSYPEVGTSELVRQHLATLSRLDLTPLDKPDPELEYLFKHITTQEVAYQSLTFGLRSTLHEKVGLFVERSYAGSLAQHVDVLAYHYGRSHNTGKQRVYFRQAGDAAKAAFANQTAIDYYQRLLPLLSEKEQCDVLLELGEVWKLMGKWSEAEEIFQNVLALATQTEERRAQALAEAELGQLFCETQSYRDALPWLERARVALNQLGDMQATSRVLSYLSNAYALQGEYEQARACSAEQLRLAMEAGDPAGLGNAYYREAMVYAHQGNFELALECFQEALDKAGKAGARLITVLANGDMAYVYWQQGAFGRALASLFAGLRVAAEIGSLQMTGFLIQNAGEIYRLQGDFPRALACYARALQVATELGDMHTVLTSLGNAAIVFGEQGRYAEAEKLFSRAIDLGRELNTAFVLCEFAYRKADLLTRQDRYAEAEPVNREALEIATQVENGEVQFGARLLSLRLHAALGIVDAPTAVTQLLSLVDEGTGARQQADVQFTIWKVSPAYKEAHTEASRLYRDLYMLTPNVEYRQRYAALTGELLPEPPPLPALPGALMGVPVDLATLLDRTVVSL